MVEYLKKVKELMRDFKEVEVLHISRGQKKKTDALSKLASVAFDHLAKGVKVEILRKPSITEFAIANVETPEENWMTPIVRYLREGILPEDKQEARSLLVRALQYEMIDGALYRKLFLGPSLKCIDPLEAEYFIQEIHEGICGMHMGAKMVAARAMRAGYYWPGIDLLGPLPEGTRKARFLVVAIDYFTKWVEEKPLTTITGQQVNRFVCENIVCRFGLPHSIVSDNGKQFASGLFKDWCQELQIEQIFTSIAHPQANWQVDRANRSIVEEIKNRLADKSILG
ncbi:uncharacterized protein LOC143582440 [Bidens hawaiensis]|uniref:uncharacterized protein LOC143582440 n=1 Tax=Bidens hawaiensis TaxID=980011 RepID=UPI00404B1D02